MSHTESNLSAEEALAQYRAELEMTSEQQLDALLKRMTIRYDSVNMCFETSIRLVKCARIAARADEIDDDDAASIVEVLSQAEDIINVGYLRYLLRPESQ